MAEFSCRIPYMLIMATLFVKMLRVYIIFSEPLSYKKRLFSDPFLFLYILLLTSPGFLVLIIWSGLDPINFLFLETPQRNYVWLSASCTNDHIIIWLVTLLANNLILSFAVACLAIKTLKIRYKHFQDTKATNAFTYLSCFVGSLTLIYWYFFSSIERNLSSVLLRDSSLYIGQCSVAVLCQILLFVPKVYQPLKRRLTQNQVKSK